MSPNASRAHVTSLGRCWHSWEVFGQSCRRDHREYGYPDNMHSGDFRRPGMPWFDVEQPGEEKIGEGGAP